jgi:hypothetical protein
LNENDLGIGPGLALIDVVLDGKPESVRLLHEVVGYRALLTSVGEVTRRAVGLRDDFEEDVVLDTVDAPADPDRGPDR